ncbi:MFS transporter [Paenibacillaceae bacterium]|nr:MFS transporter [Paenibacillaceae bacterium]
MTIWQRLIPGMNRRPTSNQRRALRTIIVEGIPATIIANLLGGPILTAYLLFLGANSSQIGFVLAIPPIANLLQIFAAFSMQRLSNRRLYVILFGIAHRTIWILTGAIPFLVPDRFQIPVFITLFFLSFAAAATSSVFWSSAVADIVPAKIRGRYFGIRNTIHWAIASLTLLAGGQLLERMSEGSAFILLYLISAACAIWNGIELARYPNPPFEKSGESSKLGLIGKPFKDRLFMKATVFISLFILIQNIAIPMFSFVMLDILRISYWHITVITTVQMIVMMISYYYWGNLNARFATKTLLLWSMPIIAVACVSFAGIAFLPVFVVLLAVHILLGFGLGGYNLLAFNFMIGDTPKSDRPMYIAVFSGLTGITGFIGPLVGGMLYTTAASGPFWIQGYGISMITGIALLLLALGLGPLALRSKVR